MGRRNRCDRGIYRAGNRLVIHCSMSGMSYIALGGLCCLELGREIIDRNHLRRVLRFGRDLHSSLPFFII